MLNMHKCIHYSLSEHTEQMMLLTETGIFFSIVYFCDLLDQPYSKYYYQDFLTSSHLFFLKTILLFQHSVCFENAAWYPGAFLWTLVTAVGKICTQYTEIYFLQILSERNALQGSKYCGYQCLDSTPHCPD